MKKRKNGLKKNNGNGGRPRNGRANGRRNQSHRNDGPYICKTAISPCTTSHLTPGIARELGYHGRGGGSHLEGSRRRRLCLLLVHPRFESQELSVTEYRGRQLLTDMSWDPELVRLVTLISPVVPSERSVLNSHLQFSETSLFQIQTKDRGKE